MNQWEAGLAVPAPEIVFALAEILEMKEVDLRTRFGWTYTSYSLIEHGKIRLREMAYHAIERASSVTRAAINWASMGIGGWIFIELAKRGWGYYDGTIDDFGRTLLTILTDADIAVSSIGFLMQIVLEWFYAVKEDFDLRKKSE